MIFAGGFILTTLAFFLTEVPVIAGQCSGSVKNIYLTYGQSGSIKSPNYPSSYERYEDCKWRIIAPSDQTVLIYFISIDLQDCSGCNCDYVKIFDGSSNSNVLTKGCGNILPPPVYSSGKYLYMTFRSDSSVQKNGFVAHYRALNSSSGCPLIDPVATAGVIYSPNFPGNYPDYTSCNWTITVPSWKMIKLNFIRFNLETSSDGYCDTDYVRVKYSQYYYGKKFCGTGIPSSITTYESISVTFYSDYGVSGSGFMAFYQTGYSFPTTASPYITYPYYTRRPTMATPGPRYDACRPYSNKRIFVGSSSSSSIASPYHYNSYYTSSPSMRCSWDIDTAEGYILQLTFDKMSISSCSSGCSCGNVQIYENMKGGSSSSNSLLGTYCSGHYPSTVTSKGNQMSVHYYGHYYDSFKATVTSKKAQTVNAAAIAVPIVIAVVLFAIIFAVIKCTKIRRSAGPAGSSITNEVPLQPLDHGTEFAPPVIEIAPPSSQPLSLNNTEAAPPSYQEPLPTASDPLPFSGDCSQGVTNIAISDETAQL